ncbi:RCC1 domain-containing protein [Micromonospora wenchangensis]|uniref:RCC1 domain-containing protein n=1 Tax=Micromonospora wenchangensis TaxID=1185415 RepID=UPI003D711035
MTTLHCRRSALAAGVAVLAMVAAIGDATTAHADGVPGGRAVTATVPAHDATGRATAKLGAVTAVGAGESHSLALRSNGTVVAWGGNQSGQLGDGTTVDRTTPVRVCAVGQDAPCTRFLTGVIAIAAGRNHNLALLRDRTVVAWGENWGDLGNGTHNNRPTPVRVCAVGQVPPCTRFLTGVRSIAAGAFHSLAVLNDTSAVAWGYNSFGELGDGTIYTRLTPVRVCAVGQVAPCTKFLSGVRSIAGGWVHTVAVADNALALAWGWNQVGQLGDGTTVGRTTPVRVCAVGQVAPCTRFLYAAGSVAANVGDSMALLGDGGPVTWGDNFTGVLGDGTFTGRTTPVRVCAVGQTAPCERFLYGIRRIAAGPVHTMAQLSSGGVLTWGDNFTGELGDGTFTGRTVPGQVCAVGQTAPCERFLYGIRDIAAGAYHSLALQPDYTVVAWGANGQGQLGDGSNEPRPTPVQVLAPQS